MIHLLYMILCVSVIVAIQIFCVVMQQAELEAKNKKKLEELKKNVS